MIRPPAGFAKGWRGSQIPFAEPWEWTCLGCGDKRRDGWKPCPRCGLAHACQPVAFTIHGEPVSQKNSRQLGRVAGQLRSFANKGVKRWHEDAAMQLAIQVGTNRITSPLNVRGVQRYGELLTLVSVYQGAGQHLDADNAVAAPLDALKKAGVITSDYWCNPLHVTRLADAERPRVEVSLEPYLYGRGET